MDSIGLSGVAAVLAPRAETLEDLAAAGRLDSPPENLRALGFERAHIADPVHDPRWLSREAATQALDDACVDPSEVDLVIWAGALASGHRWMVGREELAGVEQHRDPPGVLAEFRYPASWLQEELGLDRAQVTAVAQQGCASMFSALRLARAVLVAEEEIEHVLCVGVDVLPEGSSREILYNVISDAASAVVLSRETTRDRWVGYHQISKGYYWDTPAQQSEIAAAYFPTSRITILELLDRLDLGPDQVDLVVPTGVPLSSWEILLRLVEIPTERLYRSPRSFGHTILADNFLHLQEIRADQKSRAAPQAAKQRELLFTYGFGSTWCALLLES